MPESVAAWWSRRQWSKGAALPYEVGEFRVHWKQYPALVRQYHSDLNGGVALSQIPPSADVYLLWQCDAGHRFVATPDEQRQRPNGSRRRSTWCPECTVLAVRRVLPHAHRDEPPRARPRRTPLPCGHPRGERRRSATDDRCRTCEHARAAAFTCAVGDAFVSPWAPKPASAAEADLRQRLGARLDVDLGLTAVRVARPFFEHLEVWPDFVIAELRVAIEYDTTGRDGLEHVGSREQTDRRKDRLLRAAGWEVIRVRCGTLLPIGPWDLTAAGVSGALVDRVVERLGDVRGALLVSAYERQRE